MRNRGEPSGVSAYGMTEANGQPGCSTECVASVPMRSVSRSVRTRSAKVGSGAVGGGEKYVLLTAWDSVLGLDLERTALEGWEPSDEMKDLVRKRDEARAVRDYLTSDAIRKQLIGMGLEVMDTQQGTRVRPRG